MSEETHKYIGSMNHWFMGNKPERPSEYIEHLKRCGSGATRTVRRSGRHYDNYCDNCNIHWDHDES